jgi:uncharacterized protein (TIGR02001 family)
MKAMKIALASAIATVALSGAAMAEEATKPTISFNLGITNDYVFRGISQTQGDPAVSGGVDVGYGLFYAGTWVSNVDFGVPDPKVEVDIYAGVKPTVGDTAFDFGVLYYGYRKDKNGAPGANSYTELKAAVSHPVAGATLGAAVYYSPEWPGKGGDATYGEVNAAIPIAEKFTLSGAVGRQEIKNYADYNTWNVGIGFLLGENATIDVRYSDTNAHEIAKIYDSRVAVSLKAAF